MQSLQVMLIVAASATTLTIGIALFRSASVLWDRVVTLTNGPHVVLVARAPSPTLAELHRLDGVVEAADPLPLVRGVQLAQDARKLELWVHGVAPELPHVGRPWLTEGRWPASDREIVLDPGYAQDIGLVLGKQVHILTETERVPFTLTGLAINAAFSYPSSPPAAYVPAAGIAALQADPRPRELLLGVRLADPAGSTEFIGQATAQLPPQALSYSRDWQRTRIAVQFNNNVSVVLVRIFSVLALLAVGLIVANTTSALVLARFHEIGLLKAIGFTPAQVTLLFLAEHLALGLAGTVVGIGAGLWLFPLLFTSSFLRRIADLLATELASSIEPVVVLGVVVWIELVVGLFTLLPAWRGGRIATVQAILVGSSPVETRPSPLARLARGLRLPPPLVLGLTEAFARPRRAVIISGSLALTTILAVMVLTGLGVLAAYTRESGLVGQLPQHLLLRRGQVSHTETLRILERHPEIVRISASLPLEAQPADQAAVPIATRAIAAGADLSGLVLLEGRRPSALGEAIVPQGLLDRLRLRVGDELRLVALERRLTLQIVGRYYSAENLGLTALYSLETARQQLDLALEPRDYALLLAPGSDRRAVQDALLRESDDRFGILSWEAGDETERLQATIVALGVALLLIGMINLLNTALLGVQERIRDFGILKAVGMTPGQVLASVVASSTALSLLAALVGMPLGIALCFGIYAWVTGQGGGGLGVPVPVDWASITLLVLAASLAVAVVCSAVPAARAASLPVVDVLRHE